MYICNTGLDCEDCIGGCEQNLEWDDELDSIQLLRDFESFENFKLRKSEK